MTPQRRVSGHALKACEWVRTAIGTRAFVACTCGDQGTFPMKARGLTWHLQHKADVLASRRVVPSTREGEQ